MELEAKVQGTNAQQQQDAEELRSLEEQIQHESTSLQQVRHCTFHYAVLRQSYS